MDDTLTVPTPLEPLPYTNTDAVNPSVVSKLLEENQEGKQSIELSILIHFNLSM